MSVASQDQDQRSAAVTPGRTGGPTNAEPPWHSTEIPYWPAEQKRVLQWAPARALVRTLRDYDGLKRGGFLVPVRRALIVLRHRFWSAVTGADIPLGTRIGGGIKFPHPNGVVIHPGAVIGINCCIFQQVTLGAQRQGVPTIGAHVEIGAGAKILGAVRVGDHARIGANAVVLCDVPEGATAVGIPARIIPPAGG